MKRILTVLGAGLLCWPLLAEDARQYVPIASVEAKLMEFAPSPRALQLTSKLQAAVARDQEWWLEHVKRAEPGKPLPYDKRLGLSEEEWEEYLEIAGRQKLRQAGTVSLSVSWTSDSLVELQVAELPEFGTMEIDVSRDVVDSPYGLLNVRGSINNTLEDGPTGPWKGVSWKREEGSLEASYAVSANLSIGRLRGKEEGILYFDAKEARNGQLSRKLSVVLFYPLPQQP